MQYIRNKLPISTIAPILNMPKIPRFYLPSLPKHPNSRPSKGGGHYAQEVHAE